MYSIHHFWCPWNRFDDVNNLPLNIGIPILTSAQEPKLQNVPILVYANKNDMPCAMDLEEVSHSLDLTDQKDRKILVQSTCATTGQGIYKGLNWLSKVLWFDVIGVHVSDHVNLVYYRCCKLDWIVNIGIIKVTKILLWGFFFY